MGVNVQLLEVCLSSLKDVFGIDVEPIRSTVLSPDKTHLEAIPNDVKNLYGFGDAVYIEPSDIKTEMVAVHGYLKYRKDVFGDDEGEGALMDDLFPTVIHWGEDGYLAREFMFTLLDDGTLDTVMRLDVRIIALDGSPLSGFKSDEAFLPQDDGCIFSKVYRFDSSLVLRSEKREEDISNLNALCEGMIEDSYVEIA